jgi:hypothetical protein
LAKLDEQISVLQQRLTQLKLRQQRLDARQRAIAAERERKAELRRRILVGTLVLGKARDGGLDPGVLREWLDADLKRASDRALFDLPPLSEPGGGKEANSDP